MQSMAFEASKVAEIKKAYQQDNRAKIESFFVPEDAQAVSQAIQSIRDFHLVFNVGNENKAVLESELRKHDDDTRQKLQSEIHQNAARGIGFLYGRHQLDAEHANPILKNTIDWLNSEQTIQWIREVSGFNDITHADANVTRFARGEFLTRHNDVAPNETRRVAYVMNLSPQWHADWGGLLQFFEANGATKDAWTPTFNSMSLFNVSHIHSVTCITPFAPALRLSISGWFRA